MTACRWDVSGVEDMMDHVECTACTAPTPKGLGGGRQKRRPEVATCGGCGKRWIGDKIAHCPRCHETFTDAAAFDTHMGGDYRSGLACLKPQSVGLSTCDGIWSTRRENA